MRLIVAERVYFARALRHSSFAWLWLGQTVSHLGDSAFRTALAWQVLLMTHSGEAMGIVMVASSVPLVIFSLFGGIMADRLPRLKVILGSDILQAASILLIATLGLLNLLQLWHLIVLSAIFGTAESFFLPAIQSLPPQLVPEEDLTSANALTGMSRQIGKLLGPMLGAAFIALVGPALAFTFDGLSFLFSIACILFINRKILKTLDTMLPITKVKRVSGQMVKSIFSDLREGLAYVMSTSWLWLTILLASVNNIFYTGTSSVALPALVKEVYHAEAWVLGTAAAAGAIGAIITGATVAQWAKIKHRGVWAYIAIIVTGLAMLLYAIPVAPSWLPILLMIGAFLLGSGIEAFMVIWMTAFQELIPTEKQGRVFSVDSIGSFIFMPFGYLFSGFMVDHWGPWTVFVIGGILIIVTSLIALTAAGIRKI